MLLRSIVTGMALALTASATALGSIETRSNAHVPIEKRASTGCCPSKSDCLTVSGTNSDGLHWYYGYWEGNQKFTPADGSAVKCLTNLHHVQNDKCISVAGSSCKKNSDVDTVYENRLYGNHQISTKDSYAIQAAVDAAVANGQTFSVTGTGTLGFMTFAHTAANGSGKRGISVYFKQNGLSC